MVRVDGVAHRRQRLARQELPCPIHFNRQPQRLIERDRAAKGGRAAQHHGEDAVVISHQRQLMRFLPQLCPAGRRVIEPQGHRVIPGNRRPVRLGELALVMNRPWNCSLSHSDKRPFDSAQGKQMYGEVLLTPTIIYAKLVHDLLDAGVDIHYMVNITGHGWRKLMRSSQLFTYRITQLPPVPEVFRLIQEKGPVSKEEMYANFNMGAGYAIFVPGNFETTIKNIASQNNIKTYEVGVVEAGEKQVILEPKKITFKADSLQVKAS